MKERYLVMPRGINVGSRNRVPMGFRCAISAASRNCWRAASAAASAPSSQTTPIAREPMTTSNYGVVNHGCAAIGRLDTVEHRRLFHHTSHQPWRHG
jgi:hypothetical protein